MKRIGSWRIAALAAFVLVAVAALGAGAGQSAGDRSKATILIDGTSDSVTNIDPAGNYDYGSATVDYLLFEHLLDYRTGAGQPQPSLATRCAFRGDTLTTYFCTLRRGVKFQNGDDFTSADVKYSFDRVIKIKDPSGIYTLLSNLKSVTTNGPYGVTFNLKTAQATWPQILTTGACNIVAKGVYSADKVQSNTADQVGTGPYKLTKYSPGQQAVFEAWDDYWGPKPKNDGVIIRYYSKSSTMKLALTRGDVDMVFRDFTPTELRSLVKTKGITVYKGNGAAIRYLVLSVTRPPTNNLAVRKALAYLFPRQAIASRVYHGDVSPLYSMTPSGFPGHIDAFATLYGRSPSVAKAKAVLQKAGVKTPVSLETWFTPTHYGDASADEYAEIKRALDASGLFKVTLKSSEWAKYSDALGKEYGAFQLGWFPDYPDPENYLLPFYVKDNFTANGYSNPKMTALINKETGAKSTAARLAVIRQAQLLAARDVPIIPYWQGKMIALGRSNVHGIQRTLDPTFIMRFWLISKS
jgi:peptide/nickel transport system substrate-binding protein